MRPGVVRRLTGLLQGQRGLMAISSLCRVVNQTLGVVIPALAAAFAVGLADGSGPGLGAIVWILVGLALVKGVFRYLEQFTGHAVAFRLLALLRNAVFGWLERLEPGRLEGERSGDLVSRISGDIGRVEPFYAHTIAPLVAAIAVPLITVAGVAVLVDPWPALVLLAAGITYLAVVPWVGRRLVAERGPEARELAGESAAHAADVVQGANEIAILGAGPTVLDESTRSDRDMVAAETALARGSAARALAGGIISGAAILAMAAVTVGAGLDASDLVVSIVLAWTIMTPLRSLEEIVPDTEQALAAASRLFELEDLQPQASGDSAMSDSPARVRFEGAGVRAGDEYLVDGVDLDLAPGSLVGIVGPSGAGKSTLVQTLVRHRDLSSGRVFVGEETVDAISRASLSAAVAFVPQRPDVFHGSLRSNLAIAAPGVGDDEMMAALHRARLGDWVEGLEAGLDTPVGERGVGMSGGQLQRLSLARAFLRDPAVLVLDEATSELDPVTEMAVLEEVFAERGRRTVIVVAHRMETVASADVIAVMDRGRLVETGTHDSLRAAGELYAALWERHEDMLTGV